MTDLNSKNTSKVYLHDQEMTSRVADGKSITQIQLRKIQFEKEKEGV